MPQSPSKSDCSGEADVAPAYPTLFYHRKRLVLKTTLDTTLDVGRQREGEAAPVVRLDHSRGARVILAPMDRVEISRSHVELTPGERGHVRIRNLSGTLPIHINNTELDAGKATVVTPPVLVQFLGDAQYALRVDPPEDEDLALEGLPERTIPPGRVAGPVTLGPPSTALEETKLLQWLETVLRVFQSAANTRDFPQLAARAAVKIVGLDAAAMLCCSGVGRWRVEALYSTLAELKQEAWAPSRTLLAQVRREGRTFHSVPPKDADTPRSLQNVSALVAAPILDGAGQVIGALYGDRRSGGSCSGAPEITAFEAKLVELLASGIAAGLARLKEEQAALEARVRFEQFFTPQLAAQLERDPKLLEGRNADVTLLFADIRGFSRVSERLGPARTMAWIQDTMGALSDCVLAHDGVLVDYLGDELMAMWGAPAPQADHAALACLAARQMMQALEAINQRWQDELGGPVRLGVGLNSGVARVGNTGSRQKFKYGPLGDAVNVASRVQGATKYLGADCLITGETLKKLPSGASVRRLARVRVVNIDHPIDLYEIIAQAPLDWADRCTRYNEALTALEQDDLPQAGRLAQELVVDFPQDMAAAALEKRVRAAGKEGSHRDSTVWQLPGK